MINKNEWLIVGFITSCHGINGQLKVKSMSDFEERFLKPGMRWLQKDDEPPSKIELISGFKQPGKEIFIFEIYSSNNPFGGLMIRKLFFVSTNGTISLTNGIRTFF